MSTSLLNRQVLSLRTGDAIAMTTGAVINPNNLKIEGFYCVDDSKHELILLYQDIRDLIPQGFVVNDHEALVEPGELVRLKDILKLRFELLGKPVMTASKEKIGKVTDFSTETETMYVQKLYVSQSLLKSFSGGNLGIDRSQIVEITPNRIVINDLLKGAPAHAAVTA